MKHHITKPLIIAAIALTSFVFIWIYINDTLQKAKASADLVTVNFLPATATNNANQTYSTDVIIQAQVPKKISGVDIYVSSTGSLQITDISNPVPVSTGDSTFFTQLKKEGDPTRVHIASVARKPEAELPQAVKVRITYRGTAPGGKLLVDATRLEVGGTTSDGKFSIGAVGEFTSNVVAPSVTPAAITPTRAPSPVACATPPACIGGYLAVGDPAPNSPNQCPQYFCSMPSITPIPPTPRVITPTLAPLPDLIVTSMQIAYDTNGSALVCSTGLGIRVTVKNQGTGPVTGSFAVITNNTTSRTISGGLAAGISTSVWIPGYVATGANSARVDSANQITESNETNNLSSQALPVPTQPPACIISTTPTPTPVVQGITHYAAGSSQTGPSGSSITVYATGGRPYIPYRLVAGKGTSVNPCSTDVTELITTPIDSNASGAIANTTALINKAPGNWQLCFRTAAMINGDIQVTAPVTFAVTASVSPTPIQCSLKAKGDANCNNVIDLIDFEIWRKEFMGEKVGKDADFNSDNKIDLIDFEIWRKNRI